MCAPRINPSWVTCTAVTLSATLHAGLQSLLAAIVQPLTSAPTTVPATQALAFLSEAGCYRGLLPAMQPPLLALLDCLRRTQREELALAMCDLHCLNTRRLLAFYICTGDPL